MSNYRAKQRVEHIDVKGDGSYGDRGFIVEAGQIVDGDHPAIALHPDVFEELGPDNEPIKEEGDADDA